MEALKRNTIGILFLSCFMSFAQEEKREKILNPPVTIEVLTGDVGIASQMIINKSFRSVPRLGFFSVTNISSKWNETTSKDAMSQANITFEIVKGLRLFGGMHYTPTTGLRPTSALMYTFNYKSLLLSIGPRIDLSKDSNAEGFVMAEYKPEINENWKIYSRVQGLYAQNLNSGEHARSYLMLRLGLSYKDIRFGLGANWDAYGPEKQSKQNYGIFLAASLFN
ncbi:hypothetical protein BEI02_03630 [Elizabethkingia sp. HvH-WGS333]|uniref:hypothetical protein n=1 Tax=Elizabethkingia TaxID=308865 RepID=UPI00074209AD|nr:MULTISPECIES: hypothetical protein [Elizabethkingia]KUG13737.1 hypothetical protein AMC91_00335 [Elizabethkingia miricola]MCL1658289.1 hypothetical protein [Elizabethkingia miricola]OIK46126.1 hypothetical protein BEI02_03630 [Elizabethkingia sp. HvH-WGS333]